MRPIQRFSDEYLEQTRRIPPREILRFLEDFRLLHEPRAPSVLISIKVPERLLRAFQLRCRLEDVRYQTRIKQLMLEWLEKSGRREHPSGR